MPENDRSLPLDASPPSVRVARRWVAGALHEIGRDDLVDSAQLAVSELVTNAILHADPPITVRLRGTRTHPRVEVADTSLKPPRLEHDANGRLSTTGRGLHLIAMHAAQWGSEVDDGGVGKTVWFEPVASVDPAFGEELAGDLLEFDDEPESVEGPGLTPSTSIRIRLLNLPIDLFVVVRRHTGELHRELRLLALDAPEDNPLAVELTDTFVKVEEERLQAVGPSALDEAIARGQHHVDLEYAVLPETPATMGRFHRLLQQAYEQMALDRMLAVRPTRRLRAVIDWYLGEFVRQGRGETPVRWEDLPGDAEASESE